MDFPDGSVSKEYACKAEDTGDSGSVSGSGKSPAEGYGKTYSSFLAWRIPWAEELGGLQSKGSQRVGHNQATKHEHTHPHILEPSIHYKSQKAVTICDATVL